MDVRERMRLCTMLVKLENNPGYGKALGLKNNSTFKGKKYSEYKNGVALEAAKVRE